MIRSLLLISIENYTYFLSISIENYTYFCWFQLKTTLIFCRFQLKIHLFLLISSQENPKITLFLLKTSYLDFNSQENNKERERAGTMHDGMDNLH